MFDKAFEKVFEEILKKEGGYVNHPNDSGKSTNFGITEAVARKHGYHGHMKDFPVSYAKNIYYTDYYKNPRINEIIDDKLRMEVFDTAVNCGTKTAIKFLQESFNLINPGSPLSIDGIIGHQTLKHINNYKSQNRLLVLCNALQAEYYLKITRNNEKNESFIFGWLDKRVFN